MKKLSTLALVLAVLLLCVLTAHADTLTMPDPLDLGFAMSFYANEDNDYCYKRNYRVEDASDVRAVVLAYLERLMQYKQLDYVQCTTDPGGWIYHGFQAADDYSYDTYYQYQGDWRTMSYCASVAYNPDGQNVVFYCSKDFTLWSDAAEPTTEPATEPAAKSVDCPECKGTGDCQECGGDMWVWHYVWEYDRDGSPESVRKHELCDAIYCNGGSCSKCGGDGKL